MSFEFIKEAMEEIRYPRFFHCEPLTKEERRRLAALPELPPSYIEFLQTFGRAKFFRQLDRDRHRIRVYPPTDRLHFYGDSFTVEIAALGFSMPVLFKVSELAPGMEAPLYDIAVGIAPGSPRRRADSFTEWLTKAWNSSRRSYTKKEWEKVLAGPEPFSDEEQRIVEIRRGFSWRQLPPRNGRIVIELTNRSDGRLSFYSIGVTDECRRFKGGFRVDVSRIAPGATEVVEVSLEGAYDRSLTPAVAVLFDKGDPLPESRGDFWEFRPPKQTKQVSR